ncbi:DUF445 domain-containing protein [Microterricola pindariensis]|uniref:DUF445 domain-containing protein n=1 Tax=Microterricola pindariensis TaxID=478010 RepID=A0ABX5ATF3_9MICO|nr:DUF445 domain-containing protein [Microterricola pindariensis]PPL15722.1 hypothetical protein GY24_13890 [Microterricola pindariensis]
MTLGERTRLRGAPAAPRELSPADAARASALRGMKRLATSLLLAAAVVFTISFALQDQYPWLGYVRAASEGAMVGAIADWFAVTALFRYPLGLRIPHTAIIPNRKDEIGATLGEFVETNFLSEEVVRGKLESVDVAGRLGGWLAAPANAQRLGREVAVGAQGLLRLLSDDDVKDLLEKLARQHLFEPEWAPALGRVGEQLVAAGQQRTAIDALLAKAEDWLIVHPEAFGSAVSERLPRWLPGFVDRLVDDKAYREALGLARAMRADPRHPLRLAIDDYLAELAAGLQHDPGLIAKVEAVKAELLDSPRLREFAGEAWDSLKASLGASLAEPESELRRGLESAVVEVGTRLLADPGLAAKVNDWVADAAAHLVQSYRHDIAGVITETVERWDAAETTEKIELMVGRDLQFIRINGTVVGALAGVTIYAVATGVHALLGG